MPRPPALSDERRDSIVSFVRARADGEVRIDEEGWDSIVAIAGGGVYRFPRGEWATQRIRAEIAFLHAFAPISPIPVPEPDLLEDPLRAEYPFVAGEPLLPRVLASLSTSDRRRAAEALGAFLSALHAFPVDRALAMGLKRDAWAEAWWLGEDFRQSVLPLLGPRGRELAERALNAADPISLRPSRESVVHNDLGPEHILAHHNAISGIIDFGDAAVGDPALDFQWSIAYRSGGMHYEDDFVSAVLDHYEHEIDDSFFARVAAYRTYHGLRHVLDENQSGTPTTLDEAVSLFEDAAERLLS